MKHRYILGLDIGIASVGWSCIYTDEQEQPQGILDLGIRRFPLAEDAKTGESFSTAHSLAKLASRCYIRKKNRKKKLKSILKQHNLPISPHNDVWELRVAGLERLLTDGEWSAVLSHIVKNRGFKSTRKAADSSMVMLYAIDANNEKIVSGKYRTVAEVALKHASQSGRIRNTTCDYSHSCSRSDILNELRLLFKQQRSFGNKKATESLENDVVNVFSFQHQSLQGDDVLKMVGVCSLEPDEYRAPKHTYSFEKFALLSTLNNIRIIDNGEEFSILHDDILFLLDSAHNKSITYKTIRNHLKLSNTVRFKGLPYDNNNIESRKLPELETYKAVNKIAQELGITIDGNMVDKIGYALSVYKNNVDIKNYLTTEIDAQLIDVVIERLNFSGFGSLSLKALKNLLPLMEKGMSFYQAKTICYPQLEEVETKKYKFLPRINRHEIKNQIVSRALLQARLVVNAIIKKYGSPLYIHIETARELGKTFQERKNIQTKQEKNRKENEKAVQDFLKIFPNFVGRPKQSDLLKLKLFEQQNGECLYSGVKLNKMRLFEDGYVEIDHTIPLSRMFDDSQTNKVLVLARENQSKSNKTPFEYLGKSREWNSFVERVNACKFSPVKKQHILQKQINDKEFLERNLNDTRYIAKYFVDFVSKNLILLGKSKQKVLPVKGAYTAILRRLWQINKAREENIRHHAVDAIVVACAKCQHEPWPFFKQEVEIRVFSDTPKEDIEQKLPIRIEDNIRPLFVSMMSKHRNNGKWRKDTVYSSKMFDKGIVTSRIPLSKLKLENLDNIVGIAREPNFKKALEDRLIQHENNGEKAFTKPMFKGKQEVKSIKVKMSLSAGVLVHQKDDKKHGIARNNSIIKISVYKKNGRNYIVPVYACQNKNAPLKAAVRGKMENEWIIIDDSYTFIDDVYAGDLVSINGELLYFSSFNRNTLTISCWRHDSTKTSSDINKGISKIDFKKINVDVLGYISVSCE